MNLDDFAQQIRDMESCVTQMQHAGESSSQPQQLEIMLTAFQKLSIAVEELRVANEELHQQNEELSTAYQMVEAERQRYLELFEFAPDAYLVTDTNGVIQEANRAATTQLNVSQWFLVNKPLVIYVVEQERPAFHTQLDSLSQVDGVQEWELRLQPRDKTPITVAVMVTAIRNQQGTSVGFRWLLRDISDRKRMESELWAAHERLQLAATALDGTIYDWDVENKTVNRTQGLVGVLGYRPEEVEPTLDWWTQRIHPDDRQRIRNEISDALTCRSGFASEYRVKSKDKDNDYLYVWDKGLILRNATGQALRVVGCTTNITERKQAEDALQSLNQELEHRVRERTTELEQLNQQLKVEIAQRTSAEKALRRREQEFRALVENAPDVISRFDRQLRHLYINPAIEQVTGRPRGEFIGKTNRELGMPEPTLSFWEQLTARVFQTASQEAFEFTFVTPNGVHHYQARFVPEFAADGSIDSVLGITRDITQRKQSEDALRESEERFRQLAENIDEVFWITGSDEFELIYISPAYEQIWGKSRTSLFEQPKSWLDAVHPEDRERVTTALKKSRQENYDHEYRIVRPDGSTRWIRDRGFPVQNETGQIYRVVGIAEDITLLKQATIDTYNALQKERELSELKSRFVAMTSHEFRTPLTTIQSSVELWQRYRARWTEEKQLTYFHRIQTAVERMTQMLNDMLTIGEAESGKLEFKPTPMDVVQFCQDLVEELQQASGQQHILRFTHQYQCIAGSIDAKLLQHILSNLLSNAIKYSPVGSTVEFDLICFDGNAMFQIQDQGIGIPSEEQPRLFESFHRATNVGTIQGTGLGLAIVKQCVELHRGTITLTSEVGKGTRFTVTLPLGN